MATSRPSQCMQQMDEALLRYRISGIVEYLFDLR